MRSWFRFSVFTLSAMVLTAVVGCSGGSSTPPPPATYTIGGSITGLTGAGLVLQNNRADNLTLAASATTFTFATPITSGGAYSVTILTQPAGLVCTVTGGSGTATANVTSVAIACVKGYTIGGSVFGLTGSGLALQDNAGNNLTITATATSYTFSFTGAIPTGGAPYSITVFSDPTGQTCTVANPVGIATASVVTADVSCNTLPSVSYTIAGTVTGLTGPGLVLEDQAGINDDDLLPVAANGPFTFVDPIAAGGTYNITVLDQPAGRNCSITNASGTPTADVTNVSIVCLGDWTWIGGSSTLGSYLGQAGIYGTLGTAAAANVPGGREQALSWTDASGKQWLFGGYGADSTGTGFGGQLNDLWKFDETLGANGEWTWMGGSTITPPSTSFGAAGTPGTYGTQGVAAASNDPGGREQIASWLDSTGALWLFGGEGIDINGVTGQLSDLWKFDPTLGTYGEWTWMGGSSSVGTPFGGQIGVYGVQGTPDPANIPGGRYGAYTWKDAAGNFWLFGGDGVDAVNSNYGTAYLNDLWRYTPGASGTPGQWTWMGGGNISGGYNGTPGVYGGMGTAAPANLPGGREAGASWTDASGNFWLFGGIGADSNGNFAYLNDLWKYTPSATGDTGQWTWMGGGTTAPPTSSGLPGVYGSLGVPAAANIPGGRFSASAWIDASGNFWLFGGQGYDSTGAQGYLNDLWEYTPSKTGDTGQWTWVGGNTTVGRGGGQIGEYGTLGAASPNNNPGARYGASSWIDSNGGLLLFGGQGYDSVAAQGNLNDLWKFRP